MKKTNPKKKSKTEKLNKKVPFAAFVLSVAFIAMIWIVYSMFSNWKNALYLPGIPDLSDQPEVLQNYIQKMHSAALEEPGSGRSVGRLGMVFHANFFYEEAEQCYLRAVQLNHTEWRWLYNMALIDEELGDVQSTILNLKKVVEMNPAIGQAWFRLGTAYLKQNAYEDALYAFQTVLTMEPFTVNATSHIPLSYKGAFPLKAYASLNIGRTEFEQGKHDQACRTLTALISSHPTFGSAYRLLGQVCFALGDQDKADYYILRASDFESYIPPPDAIYDDLILYSRKPDFLIKQFQIAVRSQNTDWAFALNRLLMECKPESKDVVTELLKFSVDLQQKEAVAAYGERFSKLFRYEENGLLEITRFLILREQYDPALLLIKQIRAVNPGSVGAHLEYVSILRNQKEYQKAEAYCNNLIAAVPHNPYIKIGLARVLIEQGKYSEAAEQLSLSERIDPGIDAGVLLRARVWRGQNNTAKAIGAYRKFLKTNSENIAYQLELGNYYIELRSWEMALQHFEALLKISPNNPDYIERYARILAACPDPRLRNGQKAVEFAERLSLMRTYSEEHELRSAMTVAVAYAELKDFDNALKIVNDNLTKLRQKDVEDYYTKFEALQRLFQASKPYRL